jgi:hypothetical protein
MEPKQPQLVLKRISRKGIYIYYPGADGSKIRFLANTEYLRKLLNGSIRYLYCKPFPDRRFKQNKPTLVASV